MEKQLIPLLAAIISGSSQGIDGLNPYESLPSAQAHGVANMLYYALPLLPPEQQPQAAQKRVLKELSYVAAAREAIQQRELEALFARFEAEKITVLPLKGCIIKYLYPKPEMRNMSDIDLLIDPRQAAQIKTVMDELGYDTYYYEQGDTDVYISPARMNYEIHRSLRNGGFNASSRSFLGALVSYATPKRGYEYVLELPYEEHYAYLLCHFVDHLICGGIGVRQVMDIFLCRHRWSLEPNRLDALLGSLELKEFAATLERMADCWFGGGQGDRVTEELGTYIFGSGVFGTNTQRVADLMLRNQGTANRFAYVLKRLFLPADIMKKYFPSLKKAPFLLPFYWIFRILRGVFCRNRKLSEEMNTVIHTTDETLNERVAFYRRCGLKVYQPEPSEGGQP